MGLLDKLKQLGRKGGQGQSKKSGESRRRRSSGDYESLPGGASGKEAAEAPPERAAELAD